MMGKPHERKEDPQGNLENHDRIREYLYTYGLKEDETIIGGIILGYAESGEPERTPHERKGNPVIWVE